MLYMMSVQPEKVTIWKMVRKDMRMSSKPVYPEFGLS